jgi:hypothetical protein
MQADLSRHKLSASALQQAASRGQAAKLLLGLDCSGLSLVSRGACLSAAVTIAAYAACVVAASMHGRVLLCGIVFAICLSRSLFSSWRAVQGGQFQDMLSRYERHVV